MGDDILDFDQIIAEEFQPKDPVPFRFHGEIFKAHGDGPGMVMLQFIAAAMSDDGAATVDAMLDFLKACMPDEEYSRFVAVCNDPKIATPVEHLGVIVRGLLGKYNNPRPTGPSSSSPDGFTPTENGSADGSSSDTESATSGSPSPT